MVFDRRALLTASLALPFAGAAAQAAWTRPASLAPDMSVPLWPDGHIKPPFGLVEQLVQRSNDPRASDRMLQGISRARLDIFRPAKPNPAGTLQRTRPAAVGLWDAFGRPAGWWATAAVSLVAAFGSFMVVSRWWSIRTPSA